jgi:hypothetical protein
MGCCGSTKIQPINDKPDKPGRVKTGAGEVNLLSSASTKTDLATQTPNSEEKVVIIATLVCFRTMKNVSFGRVHRGRAPKVKLLLRKLESELVVRS